MSVYALSANGKESWKMIQDPRKNRDGHQKQWLTRTCHVPSTCQVWWWYVQWFLCYHAADTYTGTEPLIALLSSATRSAWVLSSQFGFYRTWTNGRRKRTRGPQRGWTEDTEERRDKNSYMGRMITNTVEWWQQSTQTDVKTTNWRWWWAVNIMQFAKTPCYHAWWTYTGKAWFKWADD